MQTKVCLFVLSRRAIFRSNERRLLREHGKMADMDIELTLISAALDAFQSNLLTEWGMSG